MDYIGVMRSEGSADFEKMVKSCKNMKDIRNKCSTLKDVADSLKQPIDLLESILIRLELNKKTFQMFEKASQKEIEDFWDILLKIDASLTCEHYSEIYRKTGCFAEFYFSLLLFSEIFSNYKKVWKRKLLSLPPS